MAADDYYDLLGIANNASEGEIKRAYRKQALRYHPDRNPGDAEVSDRFKAVNEAYHVLKDRKQRARYDQFGHTAFTSGGGRGEENFHFAGGFADIFDEMFGDFMGRRQRHAARGKDLRYDITISLEEAFRGKKAEISIPTKTRCPSCAGKGAASGTSAVLCRSCGGRGVARIQEGIFTLEQTCSACRGSGQTIPHPCAPCRGQGHVRQSKALSVDIPPGVEEGTRIRVSGEGEVGAQGATPGDLYIFVSVAKHRFFRRESSDLLCQVSVPMTTATLGGVIKLATIEGKTIDLSIPAGTQSADRLSFANHGMSVLHSRNRGKLFAHITVEVPVNLSRRQRKLLEEFRGEQEQQRNNPRSEGFLKKMRVFLDEHNRHG